MKFLMKRFGCLVCITLLLAVLILFLVACGITTVTTNKPHEEKGGDVITDHDHTYDEWYITTPATCTTKGEETRICEECGTKERRTVALIAHNYGEWHITIPATCTTEGEETRICEECGTEERRTVTLIAHNYGEWYITTPATCTIEGMETRTCKRCGAIETRRTNVSNVHSFGEWQVTTPATCIAEGMETRTCESCGMDETRIVELSAHNYGEWSIITSASCTQYGEQQRTCLVCNQVDTQILEKLPHTFVTDPAVEATCTTTGFTKGSHCEVCNMVFVQQSITPMVAHNYDEWLVIAPATCINEGVEAHTCKRCGKNETRTFSLNAHTYFGHDFANGICNHCGISRLSIYNGSYGYNFLGTMANGENKQAFYNDIKKEVELVHVSCDVDIDENNIFATVPFSKYGLSAEEAVEVWKTFRDDNPLYYWLLNSITYSEEGLYLKIFEEYANGDIRIAYTQDIYDKIDEYIARTSRNDSAYRLALAYHDFIIESIDYAYKEDGVTPESSEWAHSIVGVFKEKGGVCEAYARAFQLLLNASGVENLFVTGTVKEIESHAWNLVKMDDNNWYWVDVTWDDSPDWKWGITYDYFCVNDGELTIENNNGWDPCTTCFLDSHSFDTSKGSYVEFLYDLPARSNTTYESDEIRNTEFTTQGITCQIAGYDTAELYYIDATGEVAIPEYVEYNNHTFEVISLARFEGNCLLAIGTTSVFIPRTVKFIWDIALKIFTLEEIVVDQNNPYFTAVEGVLFTKSLYTLIHFPATSQLTEFVVPEKTHEIAHYAFEDCANLESLTIGKNVDTIGIANWGVGYHDSAPTGSFGGNIISGEISRIHKALMGKNELLIDAENKSFIVEDGAIYSYDKSLLHCVIDLNLKSFEIPKEVCQIEYSSTGVLIFDELPNLEELKVDENNNSFSTFEGILYNKDYSRLLFVPKAIKGCVRVKDGITEIDYSAFYNVSYATEIILPNSITSIGNCAFAFCINLTSINIPNSVENIGGYAFENCESIQSITLPDNLIAIDSGTFQNCFMLSEIIWGRNIETIGDYAFFNCAKFERFTIPDSVTSIGNYVFSSDWDRTMNLQGIIIPDSITKIGRNAFQHCNNLEYIVIGSGVQTIEMEAFYESYALKTVYYRNTINEWNSISIDVLNNETLLNATRYYYSENKPTEEGNYWHYVDGEPIAWK